MDPWTAGFRILKINVDANAYTPRLFCHRKMHLRLGQKQTRSKGFFRASEPFVWLRCEYFETSTVKNIFQWNVFQFTFECFHTEFSVPLCLRLIGMWADDVNTIMQKSCFLQQPHPYSHISDENWQSTFPTKEIRRQSKKPEVTFST